MSPEIMQLWANYKQAYEELSAGGCLPMAQDSTRELSINKAIEELLDKLNGPCLLSLEDLEEVTTEKRHKSDYNIQVGFTELMDLIEKKYEIDYRDFFKKYNNNNSIYKAKILGLTQKEYETYARTRPGDNLIAAKICVLSDFYNKVHEMPYTDFWHDLLDNEFSSISNGSLATMYSDNMEICFELQPIKFKEKEETEFKQYIFKAMRKLIFKEVSQHPIFNGIPAEEIEFHIHW